MQENADPWESCRVHATIEGLLPFTSKTDGNENQSICNSLITFYINVIPSNKHIILTLAFTYLNLEKNHH